MTISIQINGTALVPQPKTTSWRPQSIATKLDGSEALGSHWIHTLTAPLQPGSASWNWDSFDNTVLSSIQTHAPYSDMLNGTATTYSDSVVSKPIRVIETSPGGIVRSVSLELLVII